MNDTIYAPSSGSGTAGIAVIRISGERAGSILDQISDSKRPAPRYLKQTNLYDPKTREILDNSLVVWFPSPASFTGEDVVELHIHGGRASVEAVCSSLSRFERCRLAEPGEFSRRAFYNEKLDLAEIEGLADLVAAETEAQRKQALKQLSGGLSEVYESWRKALIDLLAYAEAAIDFPEEDLPNDILGNTKHKILGITEILAQYVDDDGRGERLRDGFQIVVVGEPNVGKSSLINYLAQRNVSIVSDLAGTTRDVVEVRLDLGGYLVTLADTAGMRETAQFIEAEGVRRAKNRLVTANLSVFVFDSSCRNLDRKVVDMVGQGDIVVLNKSDLHPNYQIPEALQAFSPIVISVKSGNGLDNLLKLLTERVGEYFTFAGPPPLTRLRHRGAIESCLDSLRRALVAPEVELMAEDLRLAARELGKITGRFDVEDVLDVIFSEFCIGK